jgi:hypothetical protein
MTPEDRRATYTDAAASHSSDRPLARRASWASRKTRQAQSRGSAVERRDESAHLFESTDAVEVLLVARAGSGVPLLEPPETPRTATARDRLSVAVFEAPEDRSEAVVVPCDRPCRPRPSTALRLLRRKRPPLRAVVDPTLLDDEAARRTEPLAVRNVDLAGALRTRPGVSLSSIGLGRHLVFHHNLIEYGIDNKDAGRWLFGGFMT